MSNVLNKIFYFFGQTLNLPRYVKRTIALFVDMSFCAVTVWAAFSLRLNEFFYPNEKFLIASLFSVVVAVPIFIVYGLYREIFRHYSLIAMFGMSRAMAVYFIIYSCIITFIGLEGIPRTVGLIQPLLLFFAVGSSRFLVQFSLGDLYHRRLLMSALPKAIVYGAGHSGRQLVMSLQNSLEINVVGFIDDNTSILGQKIYDKTVFSLSDLPALINSEGVSHVLLAIPSVSRRRRNEILKKVSEYQVAVRTVPSFTDIAQGRISNSAIVNLDLEDLLGREPVAPNQNLLIKNIKDKSILVSGAGGSIGSELCRQIIKLGCSKLILLDFDEFSLYKIHSELEAIQAIDKAYSKVEVVPILASAKDKNRISYVLEEWQPITVYHAAAYKHVPLVECNIAEGIENNLFSALNLATLAIKYGVQNFVLVSTDKAVRPTNVMGASKRLAEISLQALFSEQKGSDICKLAIVRFGNVLDSSGSVIPKFRQQINDGGPLTLTHPDISRYFMTIPEASQLVIQAGALAEQGDVLVLDMGEPVKISELARKMVELSGLTIRSSRNPDGDIEIIITGLRPGEKMYEELLIGSSSFETEHPKILRANETFDDWKTLEPALKKLKIHLSKNDHGKILAVLNEIVTQYTPSDTVNEIFKNSR